MSKTSSRRKTAFYEGFYDFKKYKRQQYWKKYNSQWRLMDDYLAGFNLAKENDQVLSGVALIQVTHDKFHASNERVLKYAGR